MPLPISRLERFYWWCNRHLSWMANGWFAARATELMSRRSVTIHDPLFVKSEELD